MRSVLTFVGLRVEDTGKVHRGPRSSTLDEASRNATSLRAELRRRDTHDEVLRYCHPGFDAHLLSREGCLHHAEQVRRRVQGPRGTAGGRPCRGVRHPHRLHHRGSQAVGGVSYESLRRWVNQVEVDTGQRDGVPTDIARENKELKRKNRELEETMVKSRDVVYDVVV